MHIAVEKVAWDELNANFSAKETFNEFDADSIMIIRW